MKETYTKLEVVELLVSNNNHIMQLIATSKYFVIEDELVKTYRKRFFISDEVISKYTFDEVINQAIFGR